MFGFQRKKKSRSGYELTDDDRAFAAEKRTINAQIRKVELAVKRQQLRNLKTLAETTPGVDTQPQGSSVSKILSDIRDLEAFKAEMTPEPVVEGEQSDPAEKMLLEGILDAMKSRQAQPTDETSLKTALKGQNEAPKQRPTTEIDQIIDQIPKPIRTAVRKGAVSKKRFMAEARKIADQKAEEVYKALKSGKAKK